MTMSEGKSGGSVHSLHLERRKHAVITGVTDVSSFHETEIVLGVETGTMVIGGEGLHIGKLLLDDGRLDVEGQIDSIIYERPKQIANRLRLFTKKRP